jgi:formylglycine-generating enzyme required for sulfatase activity
VPYDGPTIPLSREYFNGLLGVGFAFRGVNHVYRMGTYEITNDQWNKFTAAYGTVVGNPSSAYDRGAVYTRADFAASNVSWYEAAQFVNWLNTSTGHHAAYKFTGTQGTGDYTYAAWNAAEAAQGTNLYRHKDAFYYLPTEDEWVKAAYWHGTTLQTYATKAGESLVQGDGTSGTGWNYELYAAHPGGPWAVGSGSQELNGTYDMMGNFSEWMEGPWTSGDYGTGSSRGLRGGSFYIGLHYLAASVRSSNDPQLEYGDVGLRVASNIPVPEPASITLVLSGVIAGLLWWRVRR